MATLSDLDIKRSELNTAINDYKQAMVDFGAGTIDQTALDAAKTATQTKGDEYAKLVAQVKNDDPAVTNDDQLFSNATIMGELKRADVAKIMRHGKLNLGILAEFNDAIINPEEWLATVTGSATSYSFYDGGTGKVLRMTASTRYEGAANKVRLETLAAWPVGTSFKIRLKETGSYSASTYMALINDELGTRAKYLTNHQDTYIGQFLDENGNSSAGLRNQYNDGETTFTEFELKWVNETTLEWYRNGVLVHTSTAAFATDHKFMIEFHATNYANWVNQYLDIDWISITPP